MTDTGDLTEAWRALRRRPRLILGAALLVGLVAGGLQRLHDVPLAALSAGGRALALRLVLPSLALLLLDLARGLLLGALNLGEPTLWDGVRLVPRLITISVIELLPIASLSSGAVLAVEKLALLGHATSLPMALVLAPPLCLALVVVLIGRLALPLLPRTTSPLVAYAAACALLVEQPGAVLRSLLRFALVGLPAAALAIWLLQRGAVGLATIVGALAAAWLYALLTVLVARQPGLVLRAS